MKCLLIFLVTLIFAIGCQAPPEKRIRRVNEYESGKTLYKKENYKEAGSSFDQWLVKYPKDAQAYIDRGRAYRKLGKLKLALADFEKAITLSKSPDQNSNPLRPAIYRCVVLNSMGKHDSSKKFLNHIFKNPKFIYLGPYEQFLAYLLDGEFKLGDSNNEGAIRSLTQAVETYEMDPSAFAAEQSPFIHRLALSLRSIAHFRLQNFNEAAQDMEAHIVISAKAQLDPHPSAYKSLALALYFAENYEKCKKILPKLSVEERKDLDRALGGGFFYSE